MKKIIYILLLLVGIPAWLMSQNLTNAQRRYMMMDLMELLENYERYTSINGDPEKAVSFLSLFENDKLVIYNDLLGLSNTESLSVNEYVNLLQNRTSQTRIQNILVHEVSKSTDKWLARITFNKQNLHIGECEHVVFSSAEFYKNDYQMQLVASWDSLSRTCKIVSLTGYIQSDAAKLPANYMVFKKNHPNDSLLLCNGTSIRFDRYDQAFLARDAQFTYPVDQDMKLYLIDDTLGCNIVTMDYRPTRWRLKPHVDIFMGDVFGIQTVNDNAIQTSSSSFGWGLDVGYVYPTTKKIKHGLFFGIGFQKAQLSMSIPTMVYAYYAGPEADVDGDKYYRHYSMKDTRYHTELKELYIPFYWDMDYRINKDWSAYANIGLKAYVGYGEEKVNFETTYTTYGKYPQYGNLIIDHNTYGGETAINGFVNNAHIVRENVNDHILSDYSLDGFIGLGARRHIYKDLYGDLGFYYQTSILNNYRSTGDVAVANHKDFVTTRKVPMSYQTSGGEHIENISGYISSMRRSAFSLNASVIWKF